MRLHKFIASAGVASRRAAEVLIAEGRVTVDGERVTEMGIQIDPDRQDIRFDGKPLRRERTVYYLINKPAGFLCTTDDPWGRPTVFSLIRDRLQRRLYTVGRLDEDAEGLLIVTNDGEFANRLSHPRYGIEKAYEVRVTGSMSDETVDKARAGVWISEVDGKSTPMNVRLLRKSPKHTLLRVALRSGQSTLLRKVFSRLGHNVQRIIRTGLGPLRIWGVKKGETRSLSQAEVERLIELTRPAPTAKAKPSGRPRVRSIGRGTAKPRPSVSPAAKRSPPRRRER